MDTMHQTGADFTNSFRGLSRLKLSGLTETQQDIAGYLESVLLEQCCTVDELKMNMKPQFSIE